MKETQVVELCISHNLYRKNNKTYKLTSWLTYHFPPQKLSLENNSLEEVCRTHVSLLPPPRGLLWYATGRKDEEDGKTLVCDKRDTTSFVVIFTQHLCFLVFTKRYVQMKVKFGEKLFQTK